MTRARTATSFESFLALGFGGRGSDLTEELRRALRWHGEVAGKATYKLELTPSRRR